MCAGGRDGRQSAFSRKHQPLAAQATAAEQERVEGISVIGKNEIGIFAKYWEPGRVKTRLAKNLGENAAAEVYREMLFGLARRLSHSDAERVLSIWPADHEADFEAHFGEHWTITVQSPGDLGNKMRTYFQSAFASGATKSILIGSDCPLLTAVDLETAFAHLDEHEVVLGPTNDGGYYLIGARDRTPDVFSEMPWSTPEVWPTTVGRLAEQGVRWSALDVRFDVDDIDDLQVMQAALQQKAYQTPPWHSLQRCLAKFDL